MTSSPGSYIIVCMTTAAATLSTTDRGTTVYVWDLRVGQYIWHRGAYRLVTAVDGRTVRMGRYVLNCTIGCTVEAAP